MSAADLGGRIEIRAVSKRFESKRTAVTALEDINLTIDGSEFVVLLGPSGCGKTTLLRMIGALEAPTAGRLDVDGVPLWGPRGGRNGAALEQLGMVFQEHNLFPWFTIEDNIGLPLKLRGVSRAERRLRAAELCRLVGIEGFETRWPSELSGGMRQRAAIARALIYKPQILLMDEPFGALDAMTRDQLNEELQRVWMRQGATVVLVTHSIAEAVYLADRIVLLSPRPGRVDAVIEVPFARPRPLEVQAEPSFQKIVLELRGRLRRMMIDMAEAG